MLLDLDITQLPRTSSVTIKKMQSIGIHTMNDLLHYFPFRYEDRSRVSPIGQLLAGESVTIKGAIESAKQIFTRSGIKLQKVVIADETGKIEVTWYNQPYLVQLLQKARYISVNGNVEEFGKKLTLKPNDYEVLFELNQSTIHTGRLVPIYSEIRGLSGKTIREKVFWLIQELFTKTDPYQLAEQLEWLPSEFRNKYKLVFSPQAYQQIHFPDNQMMADDAKKRLAFDELFTIQLSNQIIKKQWQMEAVGNSFEFSAKQNKLIEKFIGSLPFVLTRAQARVSTEILTDLKKTSPMNRFLQGDVGSGKTAVAAIAAYAAHIHGYQTLFMAPTEILAEQHFATLTQLFSSKGVTIGLQTGSKKSIKKTPSRQKKANKNEQKVNNFDIVVGTHALITQSLNFEKVGLVVIDEQHRFGVAQRAALRQKGFNPHLLSMTATPIPRTVALTLYGELDLSTIDEMPIGRLPVKTHLVPNEKRIHSYEWIRTQIQTHGIQTYIICPLVEESMAETMQSVKAATQEYEYLKNTIFPDLKVGMLHGKMKPKEKEQVMLDFKSKKYDILVATSVVEVGIDVPNATVIIIEGAHRFGLAQLHQLRGRVGRGNHQSYCFLFTDEKGASHQRLQLFTQTNNGLELAEYDFKMRGAGNMYGTQQSGSIDLRVANLGDLPLIMQTKSAAEDFMTHYSLQDFPKVLEHVQKYQNLQISRD